MHVRGVDLWPEPLTRDLVEEVHHGRRVRCYGPDRPRTLVEMLERAAARMPEQEAVVDARRRLTWRELHQAARRLAAGLHAKRGVQPGDRVALLVANSAEFCVSVLACATLAAVAVTLNTKLRRAELEYMLGHSGARVLVTDPEWWDEIAPKGAALPCEAVYATRDTPEGTEPLDRLLDCRDAPPAVSPAEDDAAFIMYTSGTTGHPKGAIGTHGGIVNGAMSFARCFGLGPDERTLVAVPLFHVTGLIAQFLTMAYVGGTTVIMRQFNAAGALRLLEAERITYLVGAPTVYIMLMSQPGYRMSAATLRVVGYGGAPMPPDAVRGLREWLPAARLHNVYGMTETCSPTTILPDADAFARVSSAGRPVPTAELRTVDPGTVVECAAGEVGELLVWGPMVVPGYWANPEATTGAMGDGWLRTGDLATIDADGYVTVMDRIKDMINRGGEKVYCVEVEDVLCGHPDVLEAAVVGIPDPVYGEAVKACVVPRAGRTLDPDDVRASVARRLAKFKVPRDVEILPALPRNPSGKVVKRALKN
ncbi:MAG: AMP-binding protein [Candidatus Rokubacteria bacterium]|nr:AMP-binding protein [Candidatus Rokubacteria bacterium]